jgi:probable selenium-dependent hydroxylase accessory protein YqeC
VVEVIGIDGLHDALGLGRHELVSLIGGGGKTTSLFHLGRQLSGHSVLTTTTKMGSERDGGFPVLLAPTEAAFARHNEVLVWRDRTKRKATGVAPEDCDRWFGLPGVDHVVVEADGSRQRPFKAPHVFEPVVPAATTVLVACVGADALGRVIADQCHRPLRVAAIAGCSPYQRLTPERIATVLLSDRGSRKSCPPGARYAVAVHRVDATSRPFVDELAGLLGATPLIAIAPNPT